MIYQEKEEYNPEMEKDRFFLDNPSTVDHAQILAREYRNSGSSRSPLGYLSFQMLSAARDRILDVEAEAEIEFSNRNDIYMEDVVYSRSLGKAAAVFFAATTIHLEEAVQTGTFNYKAVLGLVDAGFTGTLMRSYKLKEDDLGVEQLSSAKLENLKELYRQDPTFTTAFQKFECLPESIKSILNTKYGREMNLKNNMRAISEDWKPLATVFLRQFKDYAFPEGVTSDSYPLIELTGSANVKPTRRDLEVLGLAPHEVELAIGAGFSKEEIENLINTSKRVN